MSGPDIDGTLPGQDIEEESSEDEKRVRLWSSELRVFVFHELGWRWRRPWMERGRVSARMVVPYRRSRLHSACGLSSVSHLDGL